MTGRVVVVCADFAETGDEAIRAGLQQLVLEAAQTLHIVHVLSVNVALLPREESAQPHTIPMVLGSLSRRVRALAELDRVAYREGQVAVEVRTGDVLTELLAAIREHHADLAVVGTHGRRGLDRFLGGSIAEALVRCAECAVLVARTSRQSTGRTEGEHATQLLPEHVVRSGEEKPWRPTDVGGELASR